MATCNPNTLLDSAACFADMPVQEQNAVIIQLLCDIAAGGGGGGSTQVFSGNYGGGTPTDTPTTSAAIAYDLDAPYNWWTWNGSAWGPTP